VPPELTFEEVVYRVYRGPLLTAEGTAWRASFRRDTSDLAARNVVARFPGRGEAAQIAAAEVDGNLAGRRFVASGGLHAEQEGEVADTESARYDAADGLVRGDRPVTVRGGGFVATGAGFTLDPHEERVRLEGGARVVAGGARR
jgi:hypothetical protein